MKGTASTGRDLLRHPGLAAMMLRHSSPLGHTGNQGRACGCHVTAPAVQVPFLDDRFCTRLLVAPPGGADTPWLVSSSPQGAVSSRAERTSVRQELPATASPLGAAPD